MKKSTNSHQQCREDRFFDVSIDMLCFLDFSGYFKRLNPAWERTLGFTREELCSKPFIEFVHPDDRERTLAQNGKVKVGGHALAFENRYLCKDGSYKWILWNAAPDFDQAVIYSVARDITHRKEAHEEREKLVKQLQAALGEVRHAPGAAADLFLLQEIRNDGNDWQTVEAYVSEHTNTTFTHSICPTCFRNVVAPQIDSERRAHHPDVPAFVIVDATIEVLDHRGSLQRPPERLRLARRHITHSLQVRARGGTRQHSAA